MRSYFGCGVTIEGERMDIAHIYGCNAALFYVHERLDPIVGDNMYVFKGKPELVKSGTILPYVNELLVVNILTKPSAGVVNEVTIVSLQKIKV